MAPSGAQYEPGRTLTTDDAPLGATVVDAAGDVATLVIDVVEDVVARVVVGTADVGAAVVGAAVVDTVVVVALTTPATAFHPRIVVPAH